MDFTRKARWVKDEHRTSRSLKSTCAGEVSCKSVKIALTYAALKNLDVMIADIQNAYLQTPSSQKYYIICGHEFGLENVEKRALIKQALYGGKTSVSDISRHLRSSIHFLGKISCEADPDIWMKPAL